jgi:hypothetical protein
MVHEVCSKKGGAYLGAEGKKKTRRGRGELGRGEGRAWKRKWIEDGGEGEGKER